MAVEDQTVEEVAGLVGVPVPNLIDMNEPWLQVELVPRDKLKEGTTMWIPIGGGVDEAGVAPDGSKGHKKYDEGGALYARAAAANKDWFQEYEDVQHKERDMEWTEDLTPKSVPEHLRRPPAGSMIKKRFFGRRIRKLYELPGVDPVEDCRKLIPYLTRFHENGGKNFDAKDVEVSWQGGTTERLVASATPGSAPLATKGEYRPNDRPRRGEKHKAWWDEEYKGPIMGDRKRARKEGHSRRGQPGPEKELPERDLPHAALAFLFPEPDTRTKGFRTLYPRHPFLIQHWGH